MIHLNCLNLKYHIVENEKYMCFKNNKQLHINNCLADKLINMMINWSLGSYLCEKQLNKHKENI